MIFLENNLPENSKEDFMLIKKNKNKENKKSLITSLKKKKRLAKKIPDLHIINKDLTIKKNIINIFFFS